ncbi:MAG: hypothetical protein DWQ36_09175 [Acidobacteria bacterium]|nr:MAG: hypothetical protein DWQ30_22420 [Acidobacteriota bacterium]REK08531.1 MAG: hypothetical protein DWQ36_09175 [Acidobacteriota bacterium]
MACRAISSSWVTRTIVVPTAFSASICTILSAAVAESRSCRLLVREFLRLVDQRPGEGDALPPAGRDLVGPMVNTIREVDPLEGGEGMATALVGRHPHADRGERGVVRRAAADRPPVSRERKL